MPEIANNGKQNSSGKSGIDRRGRQPRQLDRLTPKETAVAGCGINNGEWSQQSSQSVQPHRLRDMTAQQSGNGTSASAARTLQVQIAVDRALRIERIPVGREAQQHCGGKGDDHKGRSRSHNGCDAAAQASRHRIAFR